MYLNKVQLIGNLTRDPELRSLPSGIKVASCALATNRTWKDPSGAKKEATEYHNIVAFGKPAELIAQYMKKGSSLYVEGRLQTRSWDAQDGQKKYRTEIVVENFQFGSSAGGSRGGAPVQDKGNTQKDDDESLDTIEYPTEESSVEDIPF
jgi:single-strand DNA-binding protein